MYEVSLLFLIFISFMYLSTELTTGTGESTAGIIFAIIVLVHSIVDLYRSGNSDEYIPQDGENWHRNNTYSDNGYRYSSGGSSGSYTSRNETTLYTMRDKKDLMDNMTAMKSKDVKVNSVSKK